MSDHPTKALVISDGGLPALLALAIEAERSIGAGGVAPAVMPWPTRSHLLRPQLAAAANAARYFDAAAVEPPLAPPGGRTAPDPGMAESLCLLAALHAARSAGCARVVWPVHHHHDDVSIAADLDRIEADIDRAQLIGRLALLDGPGARPVKFETPLVDLTDTQLADLVVDLAVPVQLCWWWGPGGEHAADAPAAEERAAWLPPLAHAGWIEAAPVPQVPQAPGLPRAAV
ncbi:MAG TPA: hypothetical protein VFF69_01160 [Phycisphaerales bacterium]|nr:hypothetical protein [Phycisphaerales bacterium]